MSPSRWEEIGDYGRTLSAMRSVGPIDAPTPAPPLNSACLEYRMYVFHPGELKTSIVVGPTLNFAPDRGVRLAVSFDDLVPQVVTLVPQDFNVRNGNREWEESVKDSARVAICTMTLT